MRPMTIPVPLDRLERTLRRFGSATLIASRPGDWPRVVTVDPVVEGEDLLVPTPYENARAAVAAYPRVTLVWAPPQRHGFALIVDGTATVTGSDVRVVVDHAILHRPAAHADGPAWDD